jgi:hypothetical protein
MERLDLSSGARAVKEHEGGVTIRVKKIEIIRPRPGSTAQHEAAHVVASGKIKSATIIPSGNALGTTIPEVMTAAGAAAAAAMGHDGVGWDLFVTEQMLGVDEQTAKAKARQALSGKQEEMNEVAIILEERKTISQSDVEEARENVKRRRSGIFPVEVEISSLRGKTICFSVESINSQVQIKDDLIEFLKAA